MVLVYDGNARVSEVEGTVTVTVTEVRVGVSGVCGM
jgi:hypothetical protein